MSRLLTALLLLLAIAASACGTASGSPNVAATVNGVEIPMTTVEDAFDELQSTDFFAQQVQTAGPQEAERTGVAGILSALIQAELLTAAAEDRDIDPPTEDERRAQLEEIAAGNGQDVEGFLETLSAQQGLVPTQVEAILTAGLLEQAITEQIVSGVEVTDADIQATYDAQFGAGQLYAIFGTDPAAVESLAQDVQSLGGDIPAIEQLGQALSADQEGPQVIPAPPEMGPELDAFAASLAPGDLSPAVDAGGGVQVILHAVPGPALDEVRDEVEAATREQLSGAAVEGAITEVRFNADVVVNPRFGSYDPLTQSVTYGDPLGELQPVGGALPEGDPSQLPLDDPAGGQQPPDAADGQ